MSDKRVPDYLPEMLVEVVPQRDGSMRVDTHGRECARTREVHEALRRGEDPRHPDAPQAERAGPAKVPSNAYRSGWESVFGARVPVGQA